MDGRPQDGLQLCQEKLGFIRTHSYAAPPEERVFLEGCAQKDRELVSPEIEGADQNRLCRKAPGYGPVRPILLVLTGHLPAPHHKEFGPKQPDALCTVLLRPAGLAREVQIGTQGDLLRLRGGFCVAWTDRRLPPVPDRGTAPLEVFRLVRVGLYHHPSGASIDYDRLAVASPVHDVAQANGRGDLQGSRQDRPVGCT